MQIRLERRRAASYCLYAALAAFQLSRTAGGVVDLDLFHEMALAKESVALGYVPWRDSFAYTPTVNIVVHHEWGLGLLALVISRFLGGSGIILLKFCLIFGLGCVVTATARRRHASPIIVGLFAAIAVVLSDFGFATVRAQMFSYLFAALLLRWFDQDRQGKRSWLICAVCLFPLWANLHGGCLVGAALLAVHWLEQLIRRQPHWHLFCLGIAVVPLVAINPWGFHYHAYLIHALSMPRPAIAEWAPLWDPENRLALLNFGISLLPVGLILKQIGWRRMPGILLVAATAIAALKSNRFLPFYAIAFASYLAGPFSRVSLGKDLRRWWWHFQPVWCFVFTLATVVLIIQSAPAEPWKLQVASHPLKAQGTHLIYPVGAVDYLEHQSFRGHVMVPYDWGSYVMWKLWPQVKISFDSRYEVAYPPWRMEEDDHFYNADENWREILSKYSTDLVLVRSDLKIVAALDVEPGWQRVYRDPQFTIFAREGIHLPVFETNVPAPSGRFP